MTNESRIDGMIAVLQAAKAGKRIQYKLRKHPSDWRDIDPSWDFETADYRAKPEPREFWIDPGSVYGGILSYPPINESYIHVREVL